MNPTIYSSPQASSSISVDIDSNHLNSIADLIDEIKEGVEKNEKAKKSKAVKKLLEKLSKTKEQLKTEGETPQSKNKLQKLAKRTGEVLGKSGKYVLDNQDKIMKLLERLQDFA